MRTEQMPRSWRDARSVSLLGMGTALPGPPVSTVELLERLQSRFEVDVRRQGLVLAARLGIRTRSRSGARRTPGAAARGLSRPAKRPVPAPLEAVVKYTVRHR